MKDSEDKAVIEAMEAQKFSLEDLSPQESKIMLGDKEYELRKMNLHDEVWIRQFGKDANKLINQEDLSFMSKLAFRLLKDKSDFLAEKIKDHDDDGNPIEKTITGPEKVLLSLHGPAQKYEFIKSICVTFGISRPMFDKMIEDTLKKNGIVEEKTTPTTTSPIGEQSSTSSPPSTESEA